MVCKISEHVTIA